MKLLITGGHGYIGQYLCRHFESEDVICTSRTPKTSKERFMELLDEKSLQDICTGVDVVVHTASMDERQIPGNEKDALLANAYAARQLYLDAVKHGVRHFIYLSTFHVYGKAEGMITEDTSTSPKTDYGLTHLAAEQYLGQLSARHHVPVSVLRLTNGIGLPGEGCNKWYLVLNDFCKTAAESGKITLQSDGLGRRDFVSICDICCAVEAVIKNGGKEDFSVYNVSAEKTYSIRELSFMVAGLFQKLRGQEIQVEIPEKLSRTGANAGSQIPDFTVKSEKLSRLGWKAKETVEEVIARMINSMRQEKVQSFSMERLNLEGAFLIHPFTAYDERGYFIKDYAREILEKNGIHYELQEVFYTSSHKGVIRAIHFQREKQQPKLVRCVYGKVYDVIVDLRKDSKTFGQWEGFYLSEENKKELLVPAGFGHGYLVLEHSIVSYKCAEKFYGEFDDGIVWNDPDLGIEWPLDQVDCRILSEKDQKLDSFREFVHKNEGGFVV